MAHVNNSFKLAYNNEYYMKKSIERLRQMRTTYQDYEQGGTSVYDHTFKQKFNLDGDSLVFTPSLFNSIDGKPNSDLSGLKLHLREINVGRILKIDSSLQETMTYALVKWPNDFAGLLFGIIPVDIFEKKNEVYQNPYTGEIPIEDPEWGSYQYIRTVWSQNSFYCLLLGVGKLTSMQLCLEKICNMYFKKGAGIFDENSPLYISRKINEYYRNKRANEDIHLAENLVKKRKI